MTNYNYQENENQAYYNNQNVTNIGIDDSNLKIDQTNEEIMPINDPIFNDDIEPNT